MIITTGDDPAETIMQQAQALAGKTGWRYVARGKRSIGKLIDASGAEAAICLVQGTARLHRAGEPVRAFHPSMGFIRAKRILKGESDPMLDAAGMMPGDSVIDCTAGLGGDSLVFSVLAGPAGAVTAVESSPQLYALLLAGMAVYDSGLQKVDEALRRIEVKGTDHLDYLRSLPSGSRDIVYFDPMFRDPLHDSAAIGSLRDLANGSALSAESVEEAKRVARKTVVLKEKRGSTEFARLGFTELARGNAKTSYGVIRIEY